MGELRPGTFARLFAEVNAASNLKVRKVLTAVALVVERQAKVNASNGSHKWGTPSPASPGTGPAVISGTLRRSITHSPTVWKGIGWEVKVGTAVGFMPPYGKNKTPANKYGYYLEVAGLRNGDTYPFLKPAAEFGMRVAAPALWASEFSRGWPHA
ncbi:hypothetical protein [Peterkaempfera griseoplana]|uniref:hypothetical protein n=1 Tax=Peterkaempfera griseoplana TaxID=66896 RepID=UPI0006E407C7|nr:hypothetical protein [Peterkaempfera griseoplana]